MRAAWDSSGHGAGGSTDIAKRGRFTRSRTAHVRGAIRPSPFYGIAIAAVALAFGYLMAVLVGRAIG